MAKYEIKYGVAIIPEGATEIRDGAFSDCSSLTSVRVSKNTKIADEAFKDCPEVKIERY